MTTPTEIHIGYWRILDITYREKVTASMGPPDGVESVGERVTLTWLCDDAKEAMGRWARLVEDMGFIKDDVTITVERRGEYDA